MLNIGLIYLSQVRPNHAGFFDAAVTLSNKQIELLKADERTGEFDETSIEIYSAGRENTDDIIGASFLSTVTVDSTSLQAVALGDIFNNVLGNENIMIKEIEPEVFCIAVRPGIEIAEADFEKIKKVIKASCTLSEVQNRLEAILVGLNVTETATPVVSDGLTLARVSPTAKPSEPKNTKEPVGALSEEQFQRLVDVVTERLVKDLTDNVEGLRSVLVEFKKDKEDLEQRMVSSIMEKITPEMILSKVNVVKPVEETPVAGTESQDPLEDIKQTIENTPKTTIYDTGVTIESLIKGCESDEEFFSKVLENKAKLSIDDLETVATFDIFEQITTGSESCETFSSRASMLRRIKLGLD